jgi:hypothetical protein
MIGVGHTLRSKVGELLQWDERIKKKGKWPSRHTGAPINKFLDVVGFISSISC